MPLPSKYLKMSQVVVPACNPNTGKVDAGGSPKVQGQGHLHDRLQVSQSYTEDKNWLRKWLSGQGLLHKQEEPARY